MESLLPLIISLLSGAAGGNIAGSAMKNFNLGTLWNSVVGILGGGIGGQLLSMIGVDAGGGMDIGGIIGSVASGGVGGGVLMAVVGMVKKMMAK
ncbi:MAG: hypothetical protein AB8G16_03745 [Gammaproteobacteria bacterium]